MVRMIRRDGGDAWAHESRVEEYKAAGWRLPPPPAPAKNVPIPDTKAKRTRKR